MAKPNRKSKSLVETVPSTNAARPNSEITDFEVRYFIQTRKEIDTEKQERNKILNYGVLAVGAICASVFQYAKTTESISSPILLGLYVPVLLLIWTLIGARRVKMRQIADRWTVLHQFLSKRVPSLDWVPLENVVWKGFTESKRYLREDMLLYFGLCSVIYGLIGFVVVPMSVDGNPWWRLIALGLVAHFGVSFAWLTKPIKLHSI